MECKVLRDQLEDRDNLDSKDNEALREKRASKVCRARVDAREQEDVQASEVWTDYLVSLVKWVTRVSPVVNLVEIAFLVESKVMLVFLDHLVQLDKRDDPDTEDQGD